MEDLITRSTEDYRELRKSANRALCLIERLIETQRPCIFDEIYLTGEEVRSMFDISVRSLQNYRDDRIIPYTSIGGKILYPQSAIYKLLEQHYLKALR